MKGRCNDSNCKYVHNPDCYWHKKGAKCNLGDRCLFLHTGGRANAAAEESEGTGGDGPPDSARPKTPRPEVKAKAKAKAGKKTQAAMIESADADEE